ncbi:MAG: stage II sporulation protein M [Clostridia bacterium]|nr:stage II sporulation protein M [Clostridia bacterium]
MKINAIIINKDRNNKVKSVPEYRSKLILLTIYLSAFVILGVAVAISNKDELYQSLNISLSEYFSFIKAESRADIFIGLLSHNLLFVFIILFFSFNVFGNVFVYILSGLKIAGMSTVVTYLYSEYQLKGIEYSLFVFMPGKLIFILSIIMLILQSTSLINTIVLKKNDRRISLKGKITELVFIFILITLSTAIDTLTASMFSELFQL